MPDDFAPTATVIADSTTPAGARLTTIEVRLHRFVLAELNKHRVFSSNTSSSRAIPVARALADVLDAHLYPLRLPAERPGMAGDTDLDAPATEAARQAWDRARHNAVDSALELVRLGVHKSVVNRLLEPFLPATVILSGTHWGNFFRQRCSPLAQPEMQAAAEAIRVAYHTSTPAPVGDDAWHLPYITDQDRAETTPAMLRRIAVARCARVSYLTHDRRRDLDKDLDLYTKLIAASPPHASPLEHVATPHTPEQPRTGNFVGWTQLRHLIGI